MVYKDESFIFIKNCLVMKKILPFLAAMVCSFAAFSQTKTAGSTDALFNGAGKYFIGSIMIKQADTF